MISLATKTPVAAPPVCLLDVAQVRRAVVVGIRMAMPVTQGHAWYHRRGILDQDPTIPVAVRIAAIHSVAKANATGTLANAFTHLDRVLKRRFRLCRQRIDIELIGQDAALDYPLVDVRSPTLAFTHQFVA